MRPMLSALILACATACARQPDTGPDPRMTDPRCQGAKAQAIRYELGLLYEKQQQWQLAATMFEAIPAFHDVPQRLAAIRTLPKPAAASTQAFRYAT